eukprot:4822012-Prymnesium_polylepis.1
MPPTLPPSLKSSKAQGTKSMIFVVQLLRIGLHRAGSAQYRSGPLLQLANDTPGAVTPLRLRVAIGMLCIPPPYTLRCTA